MVNYHILCRSVHMYHFSVFLCFFLFIWPVYRTICDAAALNVFISQLWIKKGHKIGKKICFNTLYAMKIYYKLKYWSKCEFKPSLLYIKIISGLQESWVWFLKLLFSLKKKFFQMKIRFYEIIHRGFSRCCNNIVDKKM